jgi:dihydrodipicolinate synthase/N-acetylneuraminate lyase
MIEEVIRMTGRTDVLPGGVFTALITPCREDGSVDHGAIRTLVDFQATRGVSGLFVLGTAGAGPMLSVAERTDVSQTILEAAVGRLFTIVHVGTLPTSAAVDLARRAVDAGAPAIAAVPPVYYQPDFPVVRGYYEQVAAAVPDVPLLAYNNPAATGYDLRPEQAAELYEAGIIRGVKQATSVVADLHRLLALDVPVWVANAQLNTAALSMGARGAISTLTNVVPELFVALDHALRVGDLRTARATQHQIDAAAKALRHPIIGALHAGVSMRGLPGGRPRLPLRLPDRGESELLAQVVARIES